MTDVLLREIREFGEAMVLLDQLPSLISKPALENTFTTMCLNLKEKGDVTAAAKAMLLERDEARHLGRLPVGSGIIKLQARWPKPFLVRFPLFHIRKGVTTDAQVHARYLESLDLETVASMLSSFAQTMRRHAGHVEKDGTDRTEKQPLTDDEASLLADVADHPVSPVTERYERLGLSPKRGTQAAAALVDRGLLKAVTVPVPGSHVRLLEPTPSGRQALGLSASATDRHGGLEHRYWVERIAAELASDGWKVTKEAPLGNGQTVDLLVERGGCRIAIEVETGKSDWRANIQKCIAAGIDSVIIAGTRANVARAIAAGCETTGTTSPVRVMSAADVAPTLL